LNTGIFCYDRNIANLTTVEVAVFARCLSLHSVSHTEWFYLSSWEIQAQTGLNRKARKRAKKYLGSMGFLQFTKRGDLPAQSYKIDYERLAHVAESHALRVEPEEFKAGV